MIEREKKIMEYDSVFEKNEEIKKENGELKSRIKDLENEKKLLLSEKKKLLQEISNQKLGLKKILKFIFKQNKKK